VRTMLYYLAGFDIFNYKPTCKYDKFKSRKQKASCNFAENLKIQLTFDETIKYF